MLSYQVVLRFLYQRGPLRWRLGLTRISAFLAEIGNPQYSYPTIQVAGTNGKGSVSTYLAQLLCQSGVGRVGLYTSPHLFDFKERIQILGQKNASTWIDADFLCTWIDKYSALIEKHQLSYFEIITAMAFDYFREKKVVFAVIETGLGGRLDATTTVSPILTAITTIGLDHTQYLGNTLSQILDEKCGILKPTVPLIYRELAPFLHARLRRTSSLKNVPLILSDHSQLKGCDSKHGQWIGKKRLLIHGNFMDIPAQRESLVQALTCLEALVDISSANRLLPSIHLASSYNLASPPARAQEICRHNYATLFLDVAHNPEGMTALAQLIKTRYPKKQIHFYVTAMPDKNRTEILQLLGATGHSLTWAHMMSEERYRPLSENEQKILNSFNGNEALHSSTLFEQLWKSLPVHAILVVCGSFYLVGDILNAVSGAHNVQ